MAIVKRPWHQNPGLFEGWKRESTSVDETHFTRAGVHVHLGEHTANVLHEKGFSFLVNHNQFRVDGNAGILTRQEFMDLTAAAVEAHDALVKGHQPRD